MARIVRNRNFARPPAPPYPTGAVGPEGPCAPAVPLVARATHDPCSGSRE
jgi:hypothetical protein